MSAMFFFLMRLGVLARRMPNGAQEAETVGRSGYFVVVWAFAGPAFILSAWWAIEARSVVGALLATEASLVLAPWFYARVVTIRCGWLWPSFILGEAADLVFGHDKSGGGLLALVLAYRRGEPSDERRQMVAQQFGKTSEDFRGAAALAWALFESASQPVHSRRAAPSSGARDKNAEQLFAAAGYFDRRVTPPKARAMLGERRVLGAMGRGALAEAAALCQQRLPLLFERGAGRLKATGAATESDLIEAQQRGTLDVFLSAGGTVRAWSSLDLWLLHTAALVGEGKATLLRKRAAEWVVSVHPRRARWRQLLQDICAPAAKRPAAASAPPRSGDSLTDAVTAQARLQKGTDPSHAGPSASAVHAFGHAWEAVLYRDTVRQSLEDRAVALGATKPAALVARVEGEVTAAIASLVERCDLSVEPDGQPSTLVRLAADEVEQTRIEALELEIAGLHSRIAQDRRLAPVQEFAAFAHVLSLYRSVQKTSPRGRELALSSCGMGLTDFACWLWNERQQYSLANAVFRFCAIEAARTGHGEQLRINLDNLACR